MTSHPDPHVRYIQGLLENPKIVTLGVAGFAALVALVMAGEQPILLFLLPVIFVAIAASIRFPMVALWLLVAIIVSNASDNLSAQFGAPSLAKLAVPGMLVLLTARYMLYGERPYLGWLAAACLAIVLGMKAVSATWATNWIVSVNNAEGYARDVIFAMLALGFLGHKRGFQTVMHAIPVVLSVICALGIYQLIFGLHPTGFYGFARILENSGRFSGPLGDPNFFGTLVVFATPLALFQVLNARSKMAFAVWMVLSCTLLAGMIASNSRGGMLGLAVALMIFATGMTLRQVVGYTALTIVGAIAAFFLMGPENREHFATIIGVLESAGQVGDTSTEGRLASWKVAFDLFRENPLLGVGVGNFNLYYQDRALELGLIFRGEGRSTHSLYLEFLAEQGLIGLTIILGMFGLAGFSIITAVKELRRVGEERFARHMAAFGASIGGYLFAMSFLQDSFPRFLWFAVALALEARLLVAFHYGHLGAGALKGARQGA